MNFARKKKKNQNTLPLLHTSCHLQKSDANLERWSVAPFSCPDITRVVIPVGSNTGAPFSPTRLRGWIDPPAQIFVGSVQFSISLLKRVLCARHSLRGWGHRRMRRDSCLRSPLASGLGWGGQVQSVCCWDKTADCAFAHPSSAAGTVMNSTDGEESEA